jgi:hypothetical protein
MDLYVVLHHSRQGVTPCVMRSKHEPTEEQMIAALEDIGEEVELGEEEYVEAVLAGAEPEPPLNKKECDDESCPGWAVFNERDIQRCDACERFNDDEEAIAYVRGLEAVDINRHLEASAVRALGEVRNHLAAVIEEAATNPAVSTKKLVSQLETLLGRSFWLERHRWSEHAVQFAQLLSEIYAVGEETEDAETMRDPGYLVIKMAELEKSMDLPWTEIQSIFERASSVFESDKPKEKAK